MAHIAGCYELFIFVRFIKLHWPPRELDKMVVKGGVRSQEWAILIN